MSCQSTGYWEKASHPELNTLIVLACTTSFQGSKTKLPLGRILLVNIVRISTRTLEFLELVATSDSRILEAGTWRVRCVASRDASPPVVVVHADVPWRSNVDSSRPVHDSTIQHYFQLQPLVLTSIQLLTAYCLPEWDCIDTDVAAACRTNKFKECPSISNSSHLIYCHSNFSTRTATKWAVVSDEQRRTELWANKVGAGHAYKFQAQICDPARLGPVKPNPIQTKQTLGPHVNIHLIDQIICRDTYISDSTLKTYDYL
jgi:hypothetical protein